MCLIIICVSPQVHLNNNMLGWNFDNQINKTLVKYFLSINYI
jgi:hypothetical protein